MSTWVIYSGLVAGSLLVGLGAVVALAAALGAVLGRIDATRSDLDP